jgi:hypothetical protein
LLLLANNNNNKIVILYTISVCYGWALVFTKDIGWLALPLAGENGSTPELDRVIVFARTYVCQAV